MSRRRKYKTYSIPQIGCDYILLPFDNEFVFYQNGKLFSLKTGAFLKVSKNKRGTEFYSVRNGDLDKIHTFSIKKALKEFFHNKLPQIDGVQHKTIEDYPQYQLYSNNKVWSKRNNIWLKGATTNGSYFVAITNKDGVKTFYPSVEHKKYFGED